MLDLFAKYRSLCGNCRGIMLGCREDKFSGDIHIDLASALQAPFQALWAKFVLDRLARRIGRTAVWTESRLDTLHVVGRETAHRFLIWPGYAVDLGRGDDLPQPGVQFLGVAA